ncbi:MAG: hypothetical protein AABX13_01065 [Nanoarchaeota archaeon]
MSTETQQILEELKVIKLDLDYIKGHMVDIDTILTPGEEERLEESLQEFKEGKTTSLEEFKREMNHHAAHRTG